MKFVLFSCNIFFLFDNVSSDNSLFLKGPALISTRKRKLNLQEYSDEETLDLKTQIEEISANYRIFNDNIWDRLLQGLKCKNCSRSGLIAKHFLNTGFACKIQIYGSACKFVSNKCLSSPSTEKGSEIN